MCQRAVRPPNPALNERYDPPITQITSTLTREPSGHDGGSLQAVAMDSANHAVIAIRHSTFRSPLVTDTSIMQKAIRLVTHCRL